jgi:flagellar biosynthesis GTPase FlhF
MRMKTYFAGTVEAALGLASRELGGDALLVAARSTGADNRHLGAYEVTFGLPGNAPDHRDLGHFLVAQDCHPSLRDRVFETLKGSLASDSEVWVALRAGLAFQPWEPAKPCRLALAGPTGSGKTSVALKIAQQLPDSPILVDADARSVGAPLRRAAAIARCEYATAYSPKDLGEFQSLDAARPIVVDLDGCLASDAAIADWARAFAQIQDLTVLLVLPATMRTFDLMATVERHRQLRPAGLIFTRMDEASRAGGILSVGALTGLPLCAFGTGPGPIGELEPSGESRLLQLLFQSAPARERAAAAGGHR